MTDISEVLETNRMIVEENLDVRTITMGVSLLDTCGSSVDATCRRIREKRVKYARNLVATGEEIERDFGVPIVTSYSRSRVTAGTLKRLI